MNDVVWAVSYNFEQEVYDISPLEETEDINAHSITFGKPKNIWFIITTGTQEVCKVALKRYKEEMEKATGSDRPTWKGASNE
jgi:hypothetical protein